MKTFLDICKMSQKELGEYLVKYLRSKGYAPIKGDKYIYAAPREGKTEIPVMLVAHMDTVHKERIKEVQKVPYSVGSTIETRISSPQGIGGDDRCGIWAIMNLINENNVHVLFTEDEETGGKGADRFATSEIIKTIDIRYMIEIDRKGFNDAVFYRCDNKDFTEWIETNTSFKKAEGTFTDICTLMPVLKVAGVNFSSGYYNAHTTNEYVVEEELNIIIDRIGDLLALEIPDTFEYIPKTYSYGSSYGYGGWTQSSLYDYDGWSTGSKSYLYSSTKRKPERKSKYLNDTQVKLIVESSLALELYGTDELTAYGNTKPEAWLNLFKDWDELSYAMIDDYYYE